MMAFIIILFGKGGLDYLLRMRPGKVVIKMSGMNPASDLFQWDLMGIRRDRLGFILTLMRKNNGLGDFFKISGTPYGAPRFFHE